jgi:hypothetical protein
MLGIVNWGGVAAVAGAFVLILYPPLGVMWRWIRHTETRFNELQAGIDRLNSDDELDVRDLTAFKDDVGRRLVRLEDRVWGGRGR